MQNYSIKQLRHLLLNEKDFNIIKDYFHDWLDEHHETAFKIPTKNKKLLSVLKLGLSIAYKKEIVFRGEQMREVKGSHLIHGAAHLDQIDGGMTFFYFTDLDWGLMMTEVPEKEEGIISRFQTIAAENNNFDFNERQN
jgi:hypothetical protein